MRAEDIVEGLNRHIEDKRSERSIISRGHLILQRVIEPHPTFKAYKTYKAILWFVKGKNRHIVISFSHSAKVLEGQEESTQQYINTELCHLIFNWIDSSFYEEVIKGEYNGISENTYE